MTDLAVLAELLLYCSIPVVLIGGGFFLRRKFPGTDGRKAGRYAGNFLIAAGIAVLLLSAVFTLNYLGKI